MATSVETPPSTVIERRSGLTPRDFARDYLYRNRPVVLVDAISSWPALTQWTLDGLRSRFTGRDVVIKGKTYRFEEFIDLILRADPANPAPYMNQEVISKTFPELLADMRPLPWCFAPNWLPGSYPIRYIDQWFNLGAELELFIGSKGSGLHTLHYDHLHLHAFSVQIQGTKRFFLYPPEQTQFLYATKNFAGINDVVNPDLQRFPLFAQAKPIVYDLQAGEVLFVPSGWWHDTRLLTDSVSVSINTACASNWAKVRADVCRDVRPKLRFLAWCLLTGIGLLRRAQRPAA
ncbi:MAG TPA: cupin-like domain-containing protein [Planctomycetota bacterium]|nr:cupin-like domain-containing protein [Planctomycetota bacterium]